MFGIKRIRFVVVVRLNVCLNLFCVCVYCVYVSGEYIVLFICVFFFVCEIEYFFVYFF